MLEIFFSISIIFSILAVFVVLVLGIVGMTTGGKFNKKWSQKLMRMRVIIQGIVILLLVIFIGLVKD